MDPRDFYRLASQLVSSTHAAELRTAISRAYYATYNVGVELLEGLGFRPNKGPAGHGDVRSRLSNSGDPEVARVGNQPGQLQTQRITADYRLDDRGVENPKTAQAAVQQAAKMIRILDECSSEPKRTQIIRGIQEWERKISRTGR